MAARSIQTPVEKGIAYWREYGDQFRSLGAGRYEAPSTTHKGQRYEVNAEQETCSCKSRKKCKHLYGVLIAIAKPQPIRSRERTRLAKEQVLANLEAMEG